MDANSKASNEDTSESYDRELKCRCLINILCMLRCKTRFMCTDNLRYVKGTLDYELFFV